MVLPYLKELILRDQIFIVLGITIAFSLLLVIIFALYTVHLRLRNMRKARRWQRLEAEWEPIILDYLTGDKTEDSTHARITRKDHLYFLDFLLRFSERLRGAEADAITRLAEPYLPSLIKHATKGDPTQRARAVRTFSNLGVARYAENIKGALDDPSPLVAMIAARALARKDHPEYASALLDRLHRFANWSQSFLTSLLTAMGPAAALPLRQTLKNPEKIPLIRTVAADAL